MDFGMNIILFTNILYLGQDPILMYSLKGLFHSLILYSPLVCTSISKGWELVFLGHMKSSFI